jgi:hypothetical protein
MNDARISEIKLSIAQILAFITVVSPVFGTAVWTWSNVNRLNDKLIRVESDYRSLDATVTAIAEQTHANSIYRNEHEKSAAYHIRRIDENDQCCHEFKDFRARWNNSTSPSK